MNDPFTHLKQSLQVKLEDVLTSMPVAVSWANLADGRIQFVNRKFTSLFGYRIGDLTTLDDWIGKAYANPDQAEKVCEFWLMQAKPERANTGIDEIELDLRCKDGSVKTVLSSKIYLAEERWGLSTFVDITPLKQEESVIKRQALEDPLTGLLNRRAFSHLLGEALARAEAGGGRLGLLLLDLDGFKQVNDSLGHDKGDQLLRHVADRLRHAVRGVDFICRFGGDEFCVVVDKVELPDAAERVAERIVDGISRPFHLDDMVVSMTISVGIAYYGDNGADEEGLLKAADQALYRAKGAGRGIWSR